MARSCLAIAAVLLAHSLVVTQVAAYPIYWTAVKPCGSQPDRANPPHGAPVNDPNLSIVVTDSNGSPSPTVCPGNTYDVLAVYSDESCALMTVSEGGIFLDSNVIQCAQSKTQMDSGTSMMAQLAVPCNTTGQLQIRVTSSHPNIPYNQGTITLDVNPACAAQACGPVAVPSPSPPPPTTVVPPVIGGGGSNGNGTDEESSNEESSNEESSNEESSDEESSGEMYPTPPPPKKNGGGGGGKNQSPPPPKKNGGGGGGKNQSPPPPPPKGGNDNGGKDNGGKDNGGKGNGKGRKVL